MNESNLFQIFKAVRNFLFGWMNREFLIFLFFLLLSGTFWLLMALNETYEREVEVPVQLVEIPKNIVLTSDTTTNVRVMVHDKGFSLLAYLYGNKIHAINVKFSSFAQKTGVGTISSAELQKMIYKQLFSSSRIVSIKPDKFEFYFNYGLRKHVPVKLSGRITPGPSYYLSKISFSPDSVEIYASREILDSIKYVTTERLNILNLTDTLVRQVVLNKIKGVKYVPEVVNVSICPDILTEEKFEVPIIAENMPAGKILRTFPTRVTVTFTVGASLFRSIRPEGFKVVADFNEVMNNPSDKCNIYLRSVPHGVRNARINVNQVDYLIEEQ
ncbi:putative uncharacterized protein [Prevotella sp. CAG:1058]|jgi:hypothetical protein|nr:putative uncharacterized protein [Prevotella sp. CAG:1058]